MNTQYNKRPICQGFKSFNLGNFQADLLAGHPEKHGINFYGEIGMEPTAPEFTDQWFLQMRKIYLFTGQMTVEEINKRETRLRREHAEIEAEESRERKRKIINSRCNSDLPALKKRLPEYLRRKNIKYDLRSRTWQCPNHDDNHPSAVPYFNQEKPVLYCVVCNKSFDIFNIAGLLISSNDFRLQLSDVKNTLRVID